MNDRTKVISAVIVVAVVLGGGWIFVPILRDAPDKVEAEASLHLERARRLLEEYRPSEQHKSLLINQLRAANVDVDAKDSAGLAEAQGEHYQATHEVLWKSFEPKDWEQSPPRPVRPSYGNLAGQMREGVAERNKSMAANHGLLKDALSEIEDALSVTVGDASGRNHAEANRLKGAIQFQQGRAEQLKAALKREEAELYQYQLANLAAQTVQFVKSKDVVSASGINERIAAVKKVLYEADNATSEDQKRLAELDARISNMESRLAGAKKRMAAARDASDKIVAAGVDFANANGAAEFEKRLSEQNEIIRTADREAHRFQTGGLPKAEIDASGDFLKGRYFEGGSPTNLTPEFGLDHYRTERAALAAVVERGKQSITDFKSDIDRLQGMRDAFQATGASAEKQLAECAKNANEAYSQLSRIESEAEVAEEAALKLFESAAASYQQAVTSADEWVSEARDHANALSPESKERSAWGRRESGGWMSSYISAGIADCKLAKAWIQLDRYLSHSQTAMVFSSIAEPLAMKEVNPAAEEEKATQAKTSGLEEISKAVALLEKSHKTTEKNWTFVAQAAVANDLVALFGEKNYVTEAVESYRSALKGREADASNAPLAARLKHLEATSK
ncbi:MAG: hypothetical protein HY287_03240 [Planctomycetes bacterium]|nr:hypothetical protein [Planctomycetota bacterium]MBI3833326.1 hypothetical protein [Planctomycetota bacterium]